MKCYITYDYELFWGAKTGTPEGCLVEPMRALTSMFDKYGVKVNIFVDAAYLLRMRELMGGIPQLKRDYELVTNHIKELSGKGHSIQLHFHPQWVQAYFEDGDWHLDNEHYKLSDYSLDEQKALLAEALDLLQSLTANKIVAFRAGGFSIENMSELVPFFEEKGITIDTSVLRGGYVDSKFQTYDYRNIPVLTSYHFSHSHKVKDEKGAFIEYPISVMVVNSLLYLYFKIFKRKDREKSLSCYSAKKWNDGVGIGASVNYKSRIKNSINRLFANSPLYASADGTLVYFLSEVYKYCKRTYKGDDFVIIGHPKIATPRSIASLEAFIESYKGEIEYKTFS